MRYSTAALVAAGLIVSTRVAQADYAVRNLVSNQPGVAQLTDPNLVNAWGISLSPTGGAFWVSDNGSDSTTLYSGDLNGTALSKTAVTFQQVAIPGGAPTGQVFNSTTDFKVTNGTTTAAAAFIFASESGAITGWNPTVSPNTTAKAGVSVDGASLKGIALASAGGSNFLYAADFAHGTVSVFDKNFAATTLTGSFTDPNLPTGYVPFNVQSLAGKLYVTYAFKTNAGDEDETTGAGLGVVDTYDTSGNFLSRVVSPGAASPLNAPWGLAVAPSNFGAYSNDLLVGNFGDGHINAFDPTTGQFLGALQSGGADIAIDGLWGLTFGNGVTAGDANTLYFGAGPDDESNGLFGAVSTPEPTMGLLAISMGIFIQHRTNRGSRRRRDRM
jgi:uncharacterized protein (TIGR03118 family)